MHRIFTLLIFILISMEATILAAGTNIEGFVKDAQTSDFLPGANIIFVASRGAYYCRRNMLYKMFHPENIKYVHPISGINPKNSILK